MRKCFIIFSSIVNMCINTNAQVNKDQYILKDSSLVRKLGTEYCFNEKIDYKTISLNIQECNDYYIYCFQVEANLSYILNKPPTLYYGLGNNIFIIYTQSICNHDGNWIREYQKIIRLYSYNDIDEIDVINDTISNKEFSVETNLPMFSDYPIYVYRIKNSRIINKEIIDYCPSCPASDSLNMLKP